MWCESVLWQEAQQKTLWNQNTFLGLKGFCFGRCVISHVGRPYLNQVCHSRPASCSLLLISPWLWIIFKCKKGEEGCAAAALPPVVRPYDPPPPLWNFPGWKLQLLPGLSGPLNSTPNTSVLSPWGGLKLADLTSPPEQKTVILWVTVLKEFKGDNGIILLWFDITTGRHQAWILSIILHFSNTGKQFLVEAVLSVWFIILNKSKQSKSKRKEQVNCQWLAAILSCIMVVGLVLSA